MGFFCVLVRNTAVASRASWLLHSPISTCLPIIAGGHYASCAADSILARHSEIDLIAISEGDHTIIDIANQTLPFGDDDTDGDGLFDGCETQYGLDPAKMDSDDNGIIDSEEDFDSDGATNLEEQNEHEVFYYAQPSYITECSWTCVDIDQLADRDGDILPDLLERRYFQTDPYMKDSDNDGTSDMEEDFNNDGYLNISDVSCPD